MVKTLIFFLLVAAVGCKDKPHGTHVTRDTIFVDLNQDFRELNGDSIWYAAGITVYDSVLKDGMFTQVVKSHTIGLDPKHEIGLLHPKFVVVIFDNKDTERHWFGDTIRFNRCPQPEAKKEVTNINHINTLIQQ